MTTLRQAAQALCDRWDTSAWKDAPHTAVFVHELKMALAVEPDHFADPRKMVSGERADLIVSLRRNKAPLANMAADMLAADAQRADMQCFIDGMDAGEDKMFMQIEEWQRVSYNNHKRQIKGQQVTRSDSPDSHLVWAALKWARENQAEQQVAVPQGYALISLDMLKTWGVYEDVVEQCQYYAAPQPPQAAEPCYCDKSGLGKPGVSCGDCPTRDYKQKGKS